MQKFLLHDQSLSSHHFFFTVSFLERYFSADLVPFLAQAPFRQKTSMHAHQQLPNSLLSLVKCLRKHFPYNQDSWSKRHLGAETQFGPSSVTEAATHAGTVQKQANTTHSLSSYHYSCQKNYANLHNIPRDGGLINSMLVFLIYRDTTLCPSVIYCHLTRRQATKEFLLRSVSCTTTRTSMHLPNHEGRRALQLLLCCQILPVQRNLGTTANKRNSIMKRTQNSLVWSLVPLHCFFTLNTAGSVHV